MPEDATAGVDAALLAIAAAASAATSQALFRTRTEDPSLHDAPPEVRLAMHAYSCTALYPPEALPATSARGRLCGRRVDIARPRALRRRAQQELWPKSQKLHVHQNRGEREIVVELDVAIT